MDRPFHGRPKRGGNAVLERLEEVPWGELGAAYGPAEWVPEAVRGLLDPDPDERARALGWIVGGTYHQQTADEATPHVVPFLIELAADPTTPDRSRLLSFLAELVGRECIDPVADQEAADRQREAQIRKYEAQPDSPVRFYPSQWRACQSAAWCGADTLSRLLDDRDPGVRATAGLVLALLIKEGSAVLPADAPQRVALRLRDAISREDDPVSRVGHVMALGTVASRYPEARGWLRAIETAADIADPAGLSAALRLIDLGEPFDEADSRRFIDRACRFDPVAYRTLPWWSAPSFLAEPESLSDVEMGLRRRCAPLAKQCPGLRALVEERARDGPPDERANALRLLGNRRRKPDEASQGSSIDVGPDADLLVRLAAAEVETIRTISKPFALAPATTIEALKHPDAALRLRAARLLKSLETDDVVPRADELAAIAREERDPSVLKALALAFRSHRRRDGEVVPPFWHLLPAWLEAPDVSRDRSVRRSLWKCLESFAKCAPAENLSAWLINRIDDPALIAALDPDRAEAVAIFRMLDLPDWELTPTLARLLRDDPDPKVRQAAVASPSHAAAPIDKLPPVHAILGALQDDPSESVRAAAASASAPFLMDPEYDPALSGAIVRALVEALDDDPSWCVRLEAASNLGLAAPTTEEAQGVRYRQITRHAALGQSSPGHADAVAALVRAAAGDPRHDVHHAACHSLQNVAGAVPGLVALLRSASPLGRAGAASALASVGKPAATMAVPELLDALAREPEDKARYRIASAVSSLILWQDVTPWLDPLARALQDPDVRIRDRIAWGLGRAGLSAAPLAGELADCLRSDEESLRCHALGVLAGIGPAAEAALPAVMGLIHSPSISVRQLAIKAAWAINGDRPPHLVELLDALETLSSDSTKSVRAEAMRQLGAIAAAMEAGRPGRDRAMALLQAVGSEHVADVSNHCNPGAAER
jgi:HEAT repeat protein